VRDLFHPGAPRWHALVTAPQAETKAEGWLGAHVPGCDAFHPVQAYRVRIRGREHDRHRRYIPGYVFARFPGPVIWHRLFAFCPYVRDAIRLTSGLPAALDPRDLVRLHGMRAADEAQEQAKARARLFNRGDRVRVLGGLWAGQETELLDVEGTTGTIRVRLFNAEHEVRVSLAGLDKAQALAS
jgi:transcription antitermination factor NusG